MRRFHGLGSMWLLVVVVTLLAPHGARALPLTVTAAVTPIASGRFHYEFFVTNGGAEDVVIVSLTNAPMLDAFIGPTLTAPVGFLTSYDSALGFVDFLADTDLFGVGTTKGRFSFDSASGPGAGVFSTFAALTDTGNLITGNVQANVVPEPGTASLLAIGVGAVLGNAWRRRMGGATGGDALARRERGGSAGGRARGSALPP